MSEHVARRVRSRGLVVVAVALGALLASACGSSSTGQSPLCPDGIDLDGDGYGEGCELGPDCDDNDPTVNVDCCIGGRAHHGCECDPGVDQPVTCFDGPADKADVGECRKGMRYCDATTGEWTGCVGQVLPADEICDGLDNNCNGEIDEGVQTACGNCIPGCDGAGVGADPFPMPEDDPNVEADNVGLDENGDLVLDSSTVTNHYLWVANDKQGTVSKIDTRTGKEVARYATVSRRSDVLINHAGGTVPAWNQTSGGFAVNRPSRTAVDYRGDVWVANRANGYQPSITKIINAKLECEDRNGNGQIDTSWDANGDGVIDVNDPLEFFGEDDECIKFTVAVGTTGGWQARAIAIDGGIEPGDPGNAWVGMFNERAFYEIDGRTGALIQRVPATGQLAGNPYGAAIDSQGRLWFVSGCCGSATLYGINTNANPANVFAAVTIDSLTLGHGSYGIAVDKQDRVWIGAWPQGGLKRYDPATQTTVEARLDVLGGFGSTWGVRGIGIDTHDNIWAAIHSNSNGWPGAGRMARVDANTATATGFWNIAGEVPVGIGVDFDGNVWTVNQRTSNATRLHIDQTTLQPANHPMTGNQLDTFPVGPEPYTYSDFTGLSLRTITRGSGEYSVPIQGCADGEPAEWLSVDFDATTPDGTRVEIWVRAGDDLATLRSQPIYGPWLVSPADLQSPPGPVPDARYLLLIIRLISEDRESTPIVHGYEVQWACPPPIVD
jgi:hypothetical protein